MSLLWLRRAPSSGHTGAVISHDLARRLAAAGMPWHPAAGDRFAITTAGNEDDSYVLSDMTAEVHRFADGSVIGFNGTMEWALDSVALEDVLWLPREDQLRTALGQRFSRLERAGEGWVVTVALPPDDGAASPALLREADIDPERAYARALLRVLQR